MFDDYEEFITSGLFDALILCNYFNEHAPVAIRALGMGIHVFSETIAASTMAECVALCRAAEKSTAIYQLAENYPFARGTLEMKRLYDGGTLGKVLFAEGEYVHPMSPSDTRKYTGIDGNGEYHWRRYLPATYYCSHALAPLMYMTGEMPKKVIGKTILSSVETLKKYGRIRADAVGVMLVETIGGALFRVNGSSYMAPHGNWYRLSCEEGACETVRGQSKMVRLAYNKWSIPEGAEHDVTYEAQWASDAEKAEACGHGGGDYWVLRRSSIPYEAESPASSMYIARRRWLPSEYSAGARCLTAPRNIRYRISETRRSAPSGRLTICPPFPPRRSRT